MRKKQIFAFLFAFIPALVDGKRTVAEIRHWLLAECRAQCRASSGWFEPGDVTAYLAALERIGVVVHENPD